MALTMKYEGIDGELDVRGRKGFMELSSLTWGLSRAATTALGDARSDAEVITQEVVITRKQDSISALLMQETAYNGFDKTVDIEFIRTGPNNKPITYLKLTLRNAGLSSYSLSSGGDTPMESMSIRYSQIEMTSHKTGNDLAAVPNTTSLDVSTGARI